MLPSISLDGNFPVSSHNSWWLGEKYDGIRCCWNGRLQKLYTRSKRELKLKDSFVSLLPRFFLDAEIWFGRGNFFVAQSLIQEAYDLVKWHYLRIIAFDAPEVEVQRLPFEERYQLVIDRLHNIAPRLMCMSKKQLKFCAQEIIDNKGEGVILRKPTSQYENGRSPSLIKVKTTRADAEAIVIGTDENLIYLKLPTGKTFEVPYSHSQLVSPPIKGEIITFTYDSYSTHQIPVNAVLSHVRLDLAWDQIVSEYKNKGDQVTTVYPKGHWHSRNLRNFFENFAKHKNLDPINPDSWYSITIQDLKDFKGGETIVSGYLKGGLVKTILRVFPEIGLNETKFDLFTNYSQHWNEVKRRRKWFIEFAKTNHFDPLLPTPWYNVHLQKLIPKVNPLLVHHSGSVTQALSHLFPEIGFNLNSFHPSVFWQDRENRKQFFVDFASSHGFNASSVDNWYKVWRNQLRQQKDIGYIVSHHNESIPQALLDLFPDIGLQMDKFIQRRERWSDFKKRKEFFENFANANGFDPLIASNWYHHEISKAKGIKSILWYHDNSISKALLDFYPNIGLDKTRFAKVPQNYWQDMGHQREVFEKFARESKFDPLIVNNWYNIIVKKLIYVKGAASVLSYYDNNVMKAVEAIFPELNWEESKILFYSKHHWKTQTNRRQFFERFASDKNFDPLIADNWYSVQVSDIQAFRGGTLLEQFNNSLSLALMDSFPEINLDQCKFQFAPKHYWSDINNRRKFFVDIAKEIGRDPLVPDTWYSLTRKDIMKYKGASAVLSYYKGSATSALIDLFPQLNLSATKFEQVPHNYWQETNNRKKFFEDFAKEHNFDPLVAGYWHILPRNTLFNTKGASTVLSFHNRSLAKALTDLFPTMTLDLSKFEN